MTMQGREMTMQGREWVRFLVSMLVIGLLGACSSTMQTATMQTAKTTIKETVPLAYYDQYLDLAEQAIHHKKYEVAKRFLEKVFLKYPDNAQAKLLVAEMQLSRGKVDLAKMSFKRLVDEEEIKAKAMQGYGLALLISGNTDDAVSYLKKALELDSGLWRAWNGLGYYYDSRQDWEKSEVSYGRAMALQQDNVILFNNRGFSRLLQKWTDGAIDDLLQAIQLDPANKTARLNLQLALATAGEYRQAMSLAAQNTPANGLNNVGYVALLKGDYFKAESFLTQAMERSYWFHEKAWRNLGLLRSLREVEGYKVGGELSESQ